jgi:hypothetical protein
MKGSLRLLLPAGLVVLTGLACSKPQPIVPKKPVASGSVLMYFTKKVTGPVELTIDGTRIPVTREGRRTRFRHLEVDGLAQGPHRLILMSALEAFGPDQFDVDLGPGPGEFRVLFAQDLKSVLYGSPEPMPATEGLPGVRARLEP